jgi:outer membrane lipoprotein SlyB
MKVKLSTWGGLAAAISQRDQTLALTSLPADDAQRAQALATQVIAQGSASVNAKVRDTRSYELTIEKDDGTTTQVEQSDGSMTPEFAELMQLVRRHRSS